MRHDLQERIAERAHRLWEEAGRPDGEHDAHWHRAEAEIAAEDTARAPAGSGDAPGGTNGTGGTASTDALPSDPPPPGEAPPQPVGGPGGATRRKDR